MTTSAEKLLHLFFFFEIRRCVVLDSVFVLKVLIESSKNKLIVVYSLKNFAVGPSTFLKMKLLSTFKCYTDDIGDRLDNATITMRI